MPTVENFGHSTDHSNVVYTIGLDRNVIKAADNENDLFIIVHQSLKYIHRSASKLQNLLL